MVNKRQLRIVLKFGSNLITTNNTVLNYKVIDSLVSQIAKIFEEHEILLVTSGAVAAGLQYISSERSTKILKKHSLGNAHHRAINLIERHEGITISALLNKLRITKQSLNRVLRDLVKDKAIIIKKGEVDSRQRHIFLDEKGKKLFYEIFLEQKKRIFNALKKSDPDSVIKFKNVLNKIINE